MKIAFGMIVFEGDYVLEQVLSQVYPFASQILIAEGPVKYFQDLGRTTSTDGTNEILRRFPDPDRKIKIVHGRYNEKDDQCQAYMAHLHPDIDYLWNLDADECYKRDDLAKIIDYLARHEPTSVGVRSLSFFGGFDHTLTGFELKRDNFLRIFRVVPGVRWKTHRPPTILYPTDAKITRRHVSSDELWADLGVQMFHYSYVFPRQVYRKIKYYKAAVSKSRCIDNYFERIYKPWVLGDLSLRSMIEAEFLGVHEFIPSIRGECYTELFTGTHPEAITSRFDFLEGRFTFEVGLMRHKPGEFPLYSS